MIDPYISDVGEAYPSAADILAFDRPDAGPALVSRRLQVPDYLDRNMVAERHWRPPGVR
jgi:hypothetical protein